MKTFLKRINMQNKEILKALVALNDGKADLGFEKVTKYFPEYAKAGDMTVFDLLHMCSGIILTPFKESRTGINTCRPSPPPFKHGKA